MSVADPDALLQRPATRTSLPDVAAVVRPIRVEPLLDFGIIILVDLSQLFENFESAVGAFDINGAAFVPGGNDFFEVIAHQRLVQLQGFNG